MTAKWKDHCDLQVHCRTCRSKEAGRAWRESIQTTFDDVAEVDFACPRGKPWTESMTPAVPAGPPFSQVKAAIEAAPEDGGTWTALKRELKLREQVLVDAGKTTCASCVQNQHDRLIESYQRVVAKTGGMKA